MLPGPRPNFGRIQIMGDASELTKVVSTVPEQGHKEPHLELGSVQLKVAGDQRRLTDVGGGRRLLEPSPTLLP